jgi:hypothetical protein
VSTPEVDQEPTRKHHVEAPEWQPQGQFGRPVGSADPLWAQSGCAFSRCFPVGPCVGAWCPHEFEAVCLPVDPSILVVSMCRPLSRRGCFPWISDMACMHVILGGNPSLVR